MIVRCERCDTRFKLDETRLPARGARVRCSRCKHAFFVQPPGADREAVVHGLAEEAAHAKTAPPEAAWDLEETGVAGGRTIRRPAPTRKAEREGAAGARTQRSPGETQRPAPVSMPDDEEDGEWTFEDDVPGFAGGVSSLDMPESAAAAAPLESDPDESSFAGLGDPESWDLMTAPPPAAQAPAPERAAPPIATLPPAPLAQSAPQLPRVAPTLAPPEPQRESPLGMAPVQIQPTAVAQTNPAGPAEGFAAATHEGLVERTGWVAVGLLTLVIASATLRAPARSEGVLPTPIEGLELSELSGRWMENALAGPILVISGKLRNPAGAPRTVGSALVVSLLEADGAPVAEAEATAGPALGTDSLREHDPRLLRAEQERNAGLLAAQELTPGQSVAFDAVFASAPAAAQRFALEARQVQQTPHPAAPSAP